MWVTCRLALLLCLPPAQQVAALAFCFPSFSILDCSGSANVYYLFVAVRSRNSVWALQKALAWAHGYYLSDKIQYAVDDVVGKSLVSMLNLNSTTAALETVAYQRAWVIGFHRVRR